MSRGHVTPPDSNREKAVIRNPATAVAAAKCWLARWNGGAAARAVNLNVSSFHPEECGLCEYPPQELIEAVAEFLTWAGIRPQERYDPADTAYDTAPLRVEVEGFLALPPEDQARVVAEAQGYR